jgi:hypothetical protein
MLGSVSARLKPTLLGCFSLLPLKVLFLFIAILFIIANKDKYWQEIVQGGCAMKPTFLGLAMLVLVLSFAAYACKIKGVAKSISGDTPQRVIQQTLKR